MQPVKNKKLTYLLICAVAAVWGIIIYRVFFLEPGNDYTPAFAEAKPVHEPFDQYQEKPDTFKLALNYRDPFLGSAYKTEEPIVEAGPPKPSTLLPVKPLPPAINWSGIRYSGYITNPGTKKMVSIVTVNGKERMLGEGEVLDGVKLLKNKKDSILVEWLGKQKYIRQ